MIRHRVPSFWLALLFSLALATPQPAFAADPTAKKSLWGPPQNAQGSLFPLYSSLGVGVWQTQLRWDQVAVARPRRPRDPADPAYRWPAALDRAVIDARANRVGVGLVVMGAPRWANGGRPWRWAPRKPRDYAEFLSAAASRYPTVRHWMIWGEPTKAANYQPLLADRRRPLRGSGLRAPRRYAQMLDASYVALKRASRRNRIVGGNSFTTGTVAPLHWLKALRLPNGRPPRLDSYGHNPFMARPPKLSNPPLGGGLADFSDLDELHAAVRRHFGRSVPLFLSELSLPTDHPSGLFNFYLPRATQARWLADAYRIARRTPWIETLGYLSLYDPPLRSDGLQAESGLLQRDGSPKPAFEIFSRS